jgi:hypothetical protein
MCWKCKSNIDNTEFITRTAECSVCGSYLHCCKNCTFYAPGSHYDCHETIDELVKDKETANFCDSFKAKTTFASDTKTRDKAEKARDAFAALFGD